MVLQPFVENAIVHGFSSNDQVNKLSVSFELKESNIIMCTISDNGTGLNSQKQKDKRHQSFASKAIQDKLRLLNQLHARKRASSLVDIQMMDNKEHTSSRYPTGTTIFIHLPMTND